VRAALVGLDTDKWDEMWQMGANGQIWIEDTKYRVWRVWVISHLIHHRAQLGFTCGPWDTNSRTYGPSADEM